MTTLASPKMIAEKLRRVFGEDPQFTEERRNRMKEVMLEDLNDNRKEEYMSAVGLAILFDRSGGQLTSAMSDIIAQDELEEAHAQHLITEIRKMWVNGILGKRDSKMMRWSSIHSTTASWHHTSAATDAMKRSAL